MIMELARIQVSKGMEDTFEGGVREATPLFRRAKGCRSMSLRKVEEEPGVYMLMVEWERLEDHTVSFRQSADFQSWRKLVGHCFAEPPHVVHLNLVERHFEG